MRLILLLILVSGNIRLVAQVTPAVKTKTNYRDTIKIIIPKEKKFNPANATLSNSKIKTPVYDNGLTGTGMPGEVHTGLSITKRVDHEPVNTTLEKVKEIKDSANKHASRVTPLQK